MIYRFYVIKSEKIVRNLQNQNQKSLGIINILKIKNDFVENF